MNEENKELEVNKKNSDDYNKLMNESSTNIDRYYWDRKNPIIKILLLILFFAIVLGSIAIFMWAGLF